MLVRNLFHLICITAACFCNLNTIQAQHVEQIYMNDGSIVEGYIAKQIPGKTISVQSVNATIVVRADSLRSKVIEYVPVESLSNEWKKWGTENMKFVEVSGSQHLELTTLQFNNVTYPNVFLLEKGSIIKFFDVTPRLYTFSWQSMYRTVKKAHPINLFTGVSETLVLVDGTKVKGQIIEQFPGKDIKILTSEKQVLTFKPEQIDRILSEKINGDMDLWPQLDLLDQVQLKSSNKVLEGFITSRTLGKEFRMIFKDGSSCNIPMNHIVSYGKVKNPDFAPVYDRVLTLNEVYVNGLQASLSLIEKRNEEVFLREIIPSSVRTGTPITIEANYNDHDATITLVKMHNERIKVKIGNTRRKVLVPIATYQELVQSNLSYKREITYLGNTKLSFTLKENGLYMVYVKGMDKQLVISAVDN